MTSRHKNKTLAVGLAALVGSVGIHRFYLNGRNDLVGWAHFATLPASLLLFFFASTRPGILILTPLLISAISALGEALLIGLTADEKWDAIHNAASCRRSASGWPLAVLLVLAFGAGAIAVIAAIARTVDLLFTGGAYG